MADEEGTPGGHKSHEREMLSFCERLRLEEKGTASEGGQRDNARADTEVDVESKGRNASSHSSVMACYRQDLPSVEGQLSAAKTRKNEAEHHRAQQVSASVLAKHSKAEERHRQHIVEEKKNSEREVAKEESKRDAVLERKRRQEEEMKQRRLAEFAKSEKQRQEASERCAKLKKSPKSSLPETTFSSPTRPCVSLSTFDDISQYPPARMHKAHGSHQPRSGQKGTSVYDRLYHNKSTGSLTNAAKERTPPALKTAQKPVTKVTNTMSEAVTRGREKKQSSLKGSPSLSVHPGQQTSDKQKKTLQDATAAAASARKSSAPTEPTTLSSSSKPAKVVLAHSAMKKQKTDAKAAPTTAEARQRPKQPPYLSATEPRVHLPSRGGKTGREQKNGKKVQPSVSSISRNPEGSHTSTQPLATALPVPREPTEDALKGQLVHVAAEKSPRNSNDSGLGQRHSCEEVRQPTHVHPIRDPGSDYNSDDTDGQSQEKQSPKPASAHLSPNQSATHITGIPSVVIQPAEDSHVNSKPAPGLTPTLMSENALLHGELTAPSTLPRRHSDTPRRKKGIVDVTPPNIFRPDRQGSLPSSFSGDFQAHFLHLKKPSASTDSHKESQTDSEEDDGEDLPSVIKPTKIEDREARRLLVNQIMQETRAEKKDLELKLANRIMKKTRAEEKECEGKPLPSDCSAPHTLIRVPSTPIVCHPSSEKGSDGREEEEEEEGRMKKLSAPALMMKRQSVQFKTCTPYSGPVEALPSFSSEEALNTEDKDPSEMGLYLRMQPPAHRPPQSTDLILARDTSSTGGTFCDDVSSEDDGDDPSGLLVSDGFCGAMMDEVLSGSDDNDQMDDEEFHKTFQVPADDIIETDSEDEGSSRDVLPCREGEALVLTDQWVDEVESSSDEAVDVVASASDCKVEGDGVGSSPPQATQLQDEVEDSSHRRGDALSSENEGEDTVHKLGGGAKYVDNVSSESENEEQVVWDGGALCSKDGSVSPRTCKRIRLVKKDSMLLYSKLPLTSQKSFQSCPPVDDVVGTSSDEEGLSEQTEERDSGIQRTATVLPPPPLKGILKNRPPATQTSPSVKFSMENNDDERFDIEQQLTECPREDIQLHRASALTPYHHRLAEVCEEDDEEDSGDTAPESVGGHSFTDSKTLPNDCISDSETEAMPNGSGTETPTHLSSHSGSHTEIEYKYKGYENEFQSLATKSHFSDELDSYSSDSDLDTKPLSIYGV